MIKQTKMMPSAKPKCWWSDATDTLNPMNTIDTIRTRVRDIFPTMEQHLNDLIAIPSVSSATDTTPVHQSARFVAGLFEDIGCDTQILQAPTDDGRMGMPAVIATKKVSDQVPTVLLYAHHDVQPAGHLDEWHTPPFEGVRRGDRLYGRGASDDGAGVIVHVGALHVLHDNMPCNVVAYIEGEEEIGSPSFKNFVTQYHDLLDASRIVVADADNWRAGQPSITTSLRGVVSMDVTVTVLEKSVHSGAYSGPIIDAVTVASRLIATLHDDNGDVAVAGLGGTNTADVDYPENDLRRDAGVVDGVRLTGTGDIAARLWTKPTISVIGWDQRGLAQASNTLTPQTTFRLSLRTAPGTTPDECAAALEKHLHDHAPFGATVTTQVREMGPAYLADVTSQAVADQRWALDQAWQKRSTLIGCGGSIPFISDFADVFPDADVVVTGVEDPLTNAHSENESQYMPDLENAIMAEALFLMKTGGHDLS